MRHELANDPFDYFRFVNRPWIVRVWEIVDEELEQPIVRLHGDPHVARSSIRFFAGYQRGLSSPDYQPPTPDLVRHLRAEAPASRAAFPAWGESKMEPMAEASITAVVIGMETFSWLMRKNAATSHPNTSGWCVQDGCAGALAARSRRRS